MVLHCRVVGTFGHGCFQETVVRLATADYFTDMYHILTSEVVNVKL